MTLLTGWPTVTNDLGDGQSGTPVDKAWSDAAKAEIETLVHSSTNPTITPQDIIDEVVAARGSKTDLDARLDVALNEDGSLKAIAGQAVVADIQRAYFAQNLLYNDDFALWPDGDAAAPLGWTIAGAGATIARTGTGLGDTTHKKGDFAAKLTRVGNDATLTMNILKSTGSFARADVKGWPVGFGCWVWCDTPNVARVAIDDGVTQTFTGYHTGNSTWQFLVPASSLPYAISSSATKLTFFCAVSNSNASAYFSGATCLFGNYAPADYVPSPTGVGFVHFEINGALSNLTDARRTEFHLPGIIQDVNGYLKTAGTTLNIDVLTNTNTTPTFATALASTLAMSTNKFANKAVDGTYARRCLRGGFGSPGVTSLISIDTSNFAGAAADLTVAIRIRVYNRVLSRFLDYNET